MFSTVLYVWVPIYVQYCTVCVSTYLCTVLCVWVPMYSTVQYVWVCVFVVGVEAGTVDLHLVLSFKNTGTVCWARMLSLLWPQRGPAAGHQGRSILYQLLSDTAPGPAASGTRNKKNRGGRVPTGWKCTALCLSAKEEFEHVLMCFLCPSQLWINSLCALRNTIHFLICQSPASRQMHSSGGRYLPLLCFLLPVLQISSIVRPMPVT